MSTTTMHFGPEWMRTKHHPAPRPQPNTSPLPTNLPASAGASTYSALVSPAAPSQPNPQDQTHPFRYSREEMLRIYRESGWKNLGLEVDRWDGVVRDMATEPIGFKEMDEAERKLFSTPLNSEIRRRQSTTDHPTSLSSQSAGMERPRLGQSNSAISGSPHRDRFGVLMGRRRDSDGPALTIPGRKVSGALPSPRDGGLPSPRSRGFDGVLPGSGDGWLARRKASQDMLRQAANDDNPDMKKTLDSREAPVERDKVSDGQSNHRSGPPSVSERDSSSGEPTQEEQPYTNGLTNGIGDMSLNLKDTRSKTDVGHKPGGDAPLRNSPDVADLASVEWSYLDPQGQVQGPFRADVMQKWHEDGYFAPELPTKRTKTDANWITVSELVALARGGKPFLTMPLESLPPPGLTRHAESPHNGLRGLPAGEGLGQTSFQSIHTTNLRSMTLDPVLPHTNGLTESPSSSFGAGRLGNNSPDAFGGGDSSRGSYTSGDPSVGTRGVSYTNIPDPSGAYVPTRRETFDVDPTFGLRSTGFGSIPATRPMDMYGMNGVYQPTQSAWSTPFNGGVSHAYGQLNMGRAPEPTPFTTGYANQDNLALPAQPGMNRMHSNFQDDVFGNTNGTSSSFTGPPYPHAAQTPNDGGSTMSFGSVEQIPQMPMQVGPSVYPGVATHVANAPTTEPASNPATTQNQSTASPVQISSQWNGATTLTDQTPRANPFDAPHPKATNTVQVPSIPISHPSAWSRNPQSSHSSSQANDPSPWFAASHEIEDDTWKEPTGPNSLTFSNIVQHNQQQQQITSTPTAAQAAVDDVQSPEAENQKIAPLSAPAPSNVPAASKSRRKIASQQAQKTAAPVIPTAAPPMPATNSSPPPSAATTTIVRPAWSTDEDQKKASMSLREIQEAEAKKAEARKAAEREKERITKTAGAIVEDAQPFTASWGLPTSQAGSRSNLTIKEASVTSSPASVSTPVWTTAAKIPVAKKTMKEIQEEEQRRKKLAVKETLAAAVKRNYAETTNKVPAVAQPPATQTNNAWSVVGSNGKTTIPTRPPPTPSAATGPTPSPAVARPNGANASRQSTASVTKASSVAPAAVTKVDDYPINPSHDFLRWLSDSLKGLNSSVNVEDIMQMLLSFPLDPDASTTEIISDLIYAHSTTLDGRRFAAEFISKRKADVASRPKGPPNGNAASKPISIADVVKSQPKPSQPEWGGFKVVKKKNKGGRS